MAKDKRTMSEIDGVQYRRVPTWQIAFAQLQGGSAMAFYVLMGMMTYLGSEGYGIATAVVGVLLTGSRIFDGIIDPFLAVWIDKLNTKHGKLRFLLGLGFVIRAIAVLLLFNVFSNGKFGIVVFLILYLVNIVGNSIYDIAGNMIGAVITNDPKQRPTVSVWSTVYNYMFPMTFTVVSTMLILPKFNNEYTVAYLSTISVLYIAIAAVLTLVSFIGLTPVDKPENFEGITASSDEDEVSMKDMWKFLKENKEFRMYLISGVSDKLAQNVNSQSIITTMLFGILIGNIQFGTMLTIISMVPSMIFAVFGAKYAGKHGSKKAMVTWTWACIIIAAISIVFCAVIDMSLISSNTVFMVIFFVLLLLGNGSKMCVTTAGSAMRADVVDYELDRAGKYLPGIVTATYNFVDQLVSSFGATIATVCVALIGYTTTMPQPTDAATPAIKVMSLALYFGLPILGWICTIVAMKGYTLTKEEMVNVQKRIAKKKDAAQN